MCDAPGKSDSCTTGKHVYEALLGFQKHKPVYVLASHSHFYMDGTFDNLPPERLSSRLDYWYSWCDTLQITCDPPTECENRRLWISAGHGCTRPQDPMEFEQVKASDVPENE